MNKKVTLILLSIFLVGLLIFCYPTISQYYNSKVQAQNISDYDKFFDKLRVEDYTNEIEKAKEYNSKLNSLMYPLTQYKLLNTYNSVLNIRNDGMMGYISIPKLKLEIPIYHGTSATTLNVAAGHIQGSSVPIGGESTHAVISAHRGLPTSRLFTDINKLELGDTFEINVLGEVLTYEVDQIKIVKPEDVNDIKVIPGSDLVTLVTCTPYGINTHRLLVRGHRIETKNLSNKNIVNEAYKVDRIIVTSIIAIPVVLFVTLYISFKPNRKNIKNNIKNNKNDIKKDIKNNKKI